MSRHGLRFMMATIKRPLSTLSQLGDKPMTKKRRKLLKSILPHEEFHQPILKKVFGGDWQMDERLDIGKAPISKGDIYAGKVEGICANGRSGLHGIKS
jgi:hypothetical protein